MTKKPTGYRLGSYEAHRYPVGVSADILVGARHDSKMEATDPECPFTNATIRSAFRMTRFRSGSRAFLPCAEAQCPEFEAGALSHTSTRRS